MSREIRFRVWDKEYKEMRKARVLWWKNGAIDSIEDNCYDGYQMEDVELMQFTGLLDKNGKEIYEGDVLRREGYWDIKILYNDENASFGWQCVEWVVTQGKTGKTSKEEAKLYEVIGNIYENPELLEMR